MYSHDCMKILRFKLYISSSFSFYNIVLYYFRILKIGFCKCGLLTTFSAMS